MRAFSIIVACVSVVVGVFSIMLVSKFRAIYKNLDVALTNQAVTLVNSWGWIPGSLLLALAIVLIGLLILKRSEIAGRLAVPTLLILLGAAVALPMILMMPLSQVVRDVEASKTSVEVEDVGRQQTLSE